MLGFFCFKLFISPPDVKKAKMFHSFYHLNPHQDSAMNLLRSLQHIHIPPAFCISFVIVFHEIEHLKTQSLKLKSLPTAVYSRKRTNWWANLKLCHRKSDTLEWVLNWIALSNSTAGKCASMQVIKQPEHRRASTTGE